MRVMDEILRIDVRSIQERSKLEDEARELTARIGDLQKTMDQAIAEGDTPYNRGVYERADSEQRKLIARLGFVKNLLAVPRPMVTRQEVLEAWQQYAERYNASVEPDLIKYDKARRELAKQFQTIVRKQNEAMKVRDKLTAVLEALPGGVEFNIFGAADPEMEPIEGLPSTKPVVYEGQYTTGDLAFFASHGDLPQSEVWRYDAVLYGHGADIT